MGKVCLLVKTALGELLNIVTQKTHTMEYREKKEYSNKIKTIAQYKTLSNNTY